MVGQAASLAWRADGAARLRLRNRCRTMEELEEARAPLVIGCSARAGEVSLVDDMVYSVDLYQAPPAYGGILGKRRFGPKRQSAEI